MVTWNDLVAKYRLLRDKKDEIEQAYKAKVAPFTEAMQQIEAYLLDHLNRTGSESVRTGEGTFYKSTITSFKVDNPGLLREYIAQHGLTDLYTNAVSKEAVQALLDKGHPLPPGISVSSFTRVNIKKA